MISVIIQFFAVMDDDVKLRNILYVNVLMSKRTDLLLMQKDTGSSCFIVSDVLWKCIGQSRLAKCRKQVTSYGGNRIIVVGLLICAIWCEWYLLSRACSCGPAF